MSIPATAAPAAAPTPAQPGSAPANPAPKADAAPTAAEIRKLKLKLDGQDVEMSENEVIALAQKGSVSDKRFQEAATIKRQAQEILKFAEENPAEFFKRTGKNFREISEKYLMEELKKEQMSPEQRKAAENEAKLKEYEDAKKAEIEKKRQEDMDALQKQHADNYNKMFVEALTKSGLPKTAYTVKRMAELQIVNVKKKLELGPDQLAKLVREDYINEQKALFGAVEGDQLLEILGPDIVKKLSKAQIAKLKAKGIRKPAEEPSKDDEKGEQLSWREYQLRNRRRR